MQDRTPFAIESAFKANRPFILNGRRLNYDDAVDKSGIEPRRLRQMWEARLIDVMTEPAQAAPVQKPPVRRVASKTVLSAQPTPEPAAPAVEQTSAQPEAKAKVVYAQFGKFDVVSAAGEVIAKGLTKDEAQRRVQQIG